MEAPEFTAPVPRAEENSVYKKYQELVDALEQGQFEMYFQLVYSIRRDTFTGMEALSRWHHPEKGVLPPAAFLPDLASFGLLDRLDFYMLERACAFLENRHRTQQERLHLSCNFSRSSISVPDFRERFDGIVSRYDFDHRDLILEIAEDCLADDAVAARFNIANCMSRGFKAALDDFGVGYTSFLDLCDFPVDRLKIDRALVTRCDTPRGRAVLSEITQLAHHLDMEVLCEGVETDTERDIVRDCGCDYIQGYLFSRVLPQNEAMELYYRSRKERNP